MTPVSFGVREGPLCTPERRQLRRSRGRKPPQRFRCAESDAHLSQKRAELLQVCRFLRTPATALSSGLSTQVLVVVQTMDRYAQKTSKTLVVVQDMDRYEHCVGIQTEICCHHQAAWPDGKRAGLGDIGGSVSAPERHDGVFYKLLIYRYIRKSMCGNRVH